LKFSTPYTLVFSKAPDYSQLRVFGCACYPLLRLYNRHKLEFRSKKCIFLGYSSNQKGYRCLDHSSHRVYISKHVVFDENVFPAQDGALLTAPSGGSSQQVVPSLSTVLLPHLFFPSSLPSSHVSVQHPGCPIVPAIIVPSFHEPTAMGQPLLHEPSLSPPCILPSPAPSDTSSPHMVTSPNTTPDSFPHESFLSPSGDVAPQLDAFLPPFTLTRVAPLSPRDVSIPTPATRVLTRSQTGSLKPKAFPDYHLYYSIKHHLKALHFVALPPKPSCYSVAFSNPHWRAAMGSEFDALMSAGTWSLCPPTST
jgi:hypothetical protein